MSDDSPEHTLIHVICDGCDEVDVLAIVEHPRESAQTEIVSETQHTVAERHADQTGHHVEVGVTEGTAEQIRTQAKSMAASVDGAEPEDFTPEMVPDGGEPEFDNPRAMASPDTIAVDESGGRDGIAGEVVLSWVVEQTATDLHYQIVVAPAGSGWVVLRQKRRGINSEWHTVETHDASEKPRLVAMKGVGGDD